MNSNIILSSIFILSIFFWISCNTEKQHNIVEIEFPKETTTGNLPIVKKEKSLSEKIEIIKANFKRINTIGYWTDTKKIEMTGSTEGGEAEFYFNNTVLEKIVVKHFGEMGKTVSEFYIQDEQLSFVFEKRYNYNRPIYWDAKSMEENGDDQVFDIDKSEIIEDRSYFENDILIQHIHDKHVKIHFEDSYLEKEGKRLPLEFERLKKLVE